MDTEIIEWLSTGPTWMQYRVRMDLEGVTSDDPHLLSVRDAMVEDVTNAGLLSGVDSWPAAPLKRHNDSSHALHTLVFLSELGFRVGDPQLKPLVDKILDFLDNNGIPLNLFNISAAYGGSGEDQPGWMLCDAPLMVYALTLLGLENDERLLNARQKLTTYIRDNGWPCTVSQSLGKFRGPGRKSDPCPYATLLMVQLLATKPQPGEENALQTGVESLLSFWEMRKEKKMYLFGMGSDFLKLKAPLIWFDLLHVLDVFSNLPFVYQDERFLEMLSILKAKADTQGRFTAESIYMPWKNWDFGQKKVPSYWITFLSQRILNKVA